MKKQTEQKPERVRCTVWMRKDVWRMVRIAALDKSVSFAHIMEHAAAD